MTNQKQNQFTKKKFRLGLISTDNLLDTVVTEYGDFGPIFTRLLETGFEILSKELDTNFLKPEVIIYNALGKSRKLPDLDNKDNVDGYIITGSPHNAYDDVDWVNELSSFINQLLKSDYSPPLVGLCFGHQIIGRTLKPGSIGKNPLGWEVGPIGMKLTPVGKRLFEFNEDVMVIQHIHGDHVDELAPGYENIGSTEICPIQGMYRAGKVLTFQGHPEIYGDMLLKFVDQYHDKGTFSTRYYNEILSRIDTAHDGDRMARTICKFYLNLL